MSETQARDEGRMQQVVGCGEPSLYIKTVLTLKRSTMMYVYNCGID